MDIRFDDRGTIVLIEGLTEEGRDWIEENVQVEQTWGRSIVSEPRYAYQIATGATLAGLEVSF